MLRLKGQWRILLSHTSHHHHYHQRATLVNVKLKWVKDRTLDSVVSREKHLRAVLHLISTHPHTPISTHALTRRELGLTHRPTRISNFLLRFPALFHPSSPSSFTLTDPALSVHNLHLETLKQSEPDLIERLRKLLMLTLHRSLPLHTLDLLHFDLGLPADYKQSLLSRYPHLFDLFQPSGDERIWIKLLKWDPCLAISHLQRHNIEPNGNNCLAFPIRFTRGFGLKKKCVEWLKEWQTLPYTSPYEDASGLDPRTDVAEKRMVGVFHEILHLTVGKKTQRRNVSNMRMALGLPQKFTKVFERHPGIFYLSQKLATQTVVLREGYGGGRELIEKHPVVDVRERCLELIRARREGMEGEGEEFGDDEDGCLREYDSSDESGVDEEFSGSIGQRLNVGER